MRVETKQDQIPKILAPVKSYQGAIEVIAAGADELYCGVAMPIKDFALYRGAETCVQTYEELRRITDHAHNNGVEVFIAVNMPFMTENIERAWEEHIRSCVDSGVDWLIVGDLGVLSKIKEIGINVPLCASTYMAAMNHQTVNFLEKLGFSRVVLERHLTIAEISEIVKHSNIEIEVFIHGAGCSNINVDCYLFHYRFPRLNEALKDIVGVKNPCLLPFEVYDAVDTSKMLGNVSMLDAFTYCSICHLPDIVKTGVTRLKIEGRGDCVAYQKSTTRIYRDLLNLIAEGNMRKYERRVAQLKKEFFPQPPFFANLKEAICEQKRCLYSPLFHAPYKLPISWPAWTKMQFKSLVLKK